MMKVVVWSLLSGQASGHVLLEVPDTTTVASVLEKFLARKGATSSPSYVIRTKDNLVLNPYKTLRDSHVQDGDTLTLGLSEVGVGGPGCGVGCYALRHTCRAVWKDEEQIFSFGSWWVVTLMSLLIALVGLVVVAWVFCQPVTPPRKYGVVIDAGSSHSEVFVFGWPGDKASGTGEVELHHRCFIAGGINSLVTREDELGRYFGRCVGEAATHVPTHLHRSTPLYVGATAGMRILRDFDPEASMAILATLRDFLFTNTSFAVQRDQVGIIPGSSEGISGWIAVNYLMGTLEKGRRTIAAIDVGGASVQLTSEMTSPGHHWHPTSLTLFNHSHRVLGQSFLCYGVGQAQHRHDYFTVGNGSAGEATDPCLAAGVTRQLTSDDLRGPCTLTSGDRPVLQSRVNHNKLRKIFKSFNGNNGLEVQTEGSVNGQDQPEITETEPQTDRTDDSKTGSSDPDPSTWSIHGSSNPDSCERQVAALFDLNLCRSTFTYGDCLGREMVPRVDTDIVAFSGLFRHLVVLLQIQPGSSLHQFRRAVRAVCALDAEHLYARYPGVERELVEDVCFDGMYVLKLLTDGFGVDNSTWRHIHFVQEVNDTDIEWPLGYMMNQTTFLAATFGEPGLNVSLSTLLLVLFSAFLVSGVLFLRHALKVQRNSASYQRCGPHQA